MCRGKRGMLITKAIIRAIHLDIICFSAYRGFCSSSCVSTGSGVLAPFSLSFLPDGLFTSVFSTAAKFVALSLPPDLDEADCGLTVSGSSTSGKRAYSLIPSDGILP